MRLIISAIMVVLFTSTAFSQTTIVEYNFNSSDQGWTNTGTDNWVRGDSDFSTGADGNYWGFPNDGGGYADDQDAVLTSPVIDLGNYHTLTFSIDVRYDTEDAWDGFNIEYSDDGGTSWTILGAIGEGTNWYNDTDVDAIGNGIDGWSDDNGAWETASISLPSALGANEQSRFRIQFASDGSITETGVAIDNVTISGTQFDVPSGDNPAGISATTLLWLRSDSSFVNDGSNVTAWGDWSGNNNHASAAVSPAYTSNGINGYPTASFDGTDDYFDLGDIFDFQPQTDEWSFFAVYNVDTDGTLLSRASDASTANRQYQYYVLGNFAQIIGGQTTTGTATGTDVWNIAASTTSTSATNVNTNGASDISGGSIGTATESTNVLVGARSDGTGFQLDGDLAEIIVFYSALGSTDLRDVESYLALKYGISLDVSSTGYTIGGTEIFDPADISGYQNDIAGIGQSNTMGLTQSSSKSASGNIVEISNASGVADTEFLFWGHDNGAITTTTSDVPGGIDNRISRIWRVSETGDLGTVDVSFDITSLGLSSSIFNLITASSGASMPTGLSSGTVSSAGTVSVVDGREIVTFSGITLNDQEYFTLAVADAPSPGDVSANLTLWLKADAGVTQSSNAVSDWADQSGNNNDATQGTPANQPTYVSSAINGHPTIDFATDQISGTAGFNTLEYFIVTQPDVAIDGSANGFIVGFETGEFGGFYLGDQTDGFVGPNERIVHGVGDSGDGDVHRAGIETGTFASANESLIFSVRNNAGATAQEIGLNGTDLTVDNSFTGNALNNLSNQAYRIGNNFLSNNGYDGTIAEVISYSSRLSNSTRRDVETYLALKYGISLDISGADYTVGGSSIFTHNTYDNDIAGIGFDQSQGLNQTSSTSESGGILTIGASGTLDDGDFFVWGHDGASTASTTSDVPVATDNRVTRVWRTDITATPGTMDVTFDINALGLPSIATYHLIISSSATMASGSLTSSPTLSGNSLTFSGVTFSDGDYFTLAFDDLPTPGDVSTNLSLWLEAGTGVTLNGSTVSNWADQTGNGNDATQATADDQPTYVSNDLNGNPSMSFDGNDVLEGAAGFYTQEYFVVTVPSGIYNSGSASGSIIGFETGEFARLGLGPTSGQITNEVITHSAGSGASYRGAFTSTTTDLNQPAIINPRQNAANDGIQLFYNGADTLNAEANAGTYTNYSNTDYDVGDEVGATPSAPFEGTIAEIISYSARLSDANRRDVSSYLAIKYGITLDISAQNYTAGGAAIYDHSSYASDIAGIGFNESSNLNQTSSKSVNSGTIVRIENASDLEDGEYLVWGNNGNSNTFTTNNAPAGTTEVFEKIWRVKETGGDGVGTVSISFDITSLGFDKDNSTLNLITLASAQTAPDDFDTDGVVNSSGVISTVDGRDLVTFDNVDLSDGDYFTFGGDIQTTTPGGSNLAFWVRADNGVTSSSNLVSSWSDQSGNGNDITQGNTSSQPTLSANEINYNDAIYFNNDQLETIAGFHSQDYFVVVKPDVTIDNTTANGYVLGFETQAASGFYVGDQNIVGSDLFGQTLETANYDAAATAASISNDNVVILNSRNNSGATAQEFFANGSSFAATTAGTFANVTDNPIRVGNNFDNDNAFEGYVAEVISYSASLTDNQRRDVESYLGLKYGVTLDVSTDAYTADSADIFDFTTYINDIAGIGRHLDYGLDQTQAVSQNTGAIVKVEGASDMDDNEYVIWANNGSSKTTPQTSELEAGFEERLPVEWRVSVVGSPGTVTIKIYTGSIDNFSNRSQTASFYDLLINTDGDFNTVSSSVTASSLSNDTLTFNTVSLDSGDYFTLALPSEPSVTGQTLWLKADAGIEEANGNDAEANDLVEFWRDQSGNNNDFDQSTFARRPTYLTNSLNGNPVVNFNDGYTYLDLTSSNLNPRSIFVVYRDTSTAQFTTPFTNNDGNGIGHGHSDETQLFNATFTPADVRNGDNFVDGTDITDGTSQARPTNYEVHSRVFVSNLSDANHDYYVGIDRGTDDRSIDGDIAEILVYTSSLSSTERRDIETYLAIKYGITLDISSANYTYNGGNTIYDLNSYSNDIAGIGSNSTLSLAQTNSQSENSDAIISVSAATNQGSGDFLVWGNDNGVTTETTSTTPPGIGNRMTRIWGVSETNDIGTVTVSFDLSGLGYGAKDVTDFTLILDGNADFSDGTLRSYSAQSFATDVVTFSGVDFTSAVNFGLGTTVDLATDTDLDGIPDYFESAYGTDHTDVNDPVTNGGNDADNDGLSDALENILTTNGGSSPVTVFSDTDGDGIPDHLEVTNGTDPFSANAPTTNGDNDSDNDGLPDGIEALIASEGGAADAAINTDTDSDGVTDYYEVMNGNDPNDANDPVASGGTDTDGDGLSDALEQILSDGGTPATISETSDTDGDGVPDYIEALTFTDPYNAASPAAIGTPSVRALQADYVASGGSCVNISGYEWIDVTDNLGNLVFSINPVGNNLGSTCWGVRILDGTASVRDDGQDWILNRNWYITPTIQPSSEVYVRFYSLTSENNDLYTELGNDGESPGSTQNDFDTDSLKITKISGIDNLDPFVTGGTRTLHNPIVSNYDVNGKSLTIEITSFSGFTPHFNPGNPDEVLPVELVSFSATATERTVLLSWETASELNNDFFTIERSVDGAVFEEIGTVEGVGTTNESTTYGFTDPDPINGISYYRLKQTDFDGTTDHSEIVLVTFNTEVGSIMMFPNPAQDYVNIEVEDLDPRESISLEMIDPSGRIIRPTFDVTDHRLTFSTQDYQNGLYILKLEIRGQISQMRLVIMN